MSRGANVQRPEILHELNKSLVDFGIVVARELTSIQHQIGEILGWIAERENHWRLELHKCEVELNAAQRAYQACISQPPDKKGIRPSCIAQATAIAEANRARNSAHQELIKIQTWKSTLRSKIATYVAEATRVQKTANDILGQASTFLRNKSTELGDYSDTSTPELIQSVGGHGNQFRKAKQEMLFRALDDPLIGRNIKGWIRNELRRIQNLETARADPVRRQMIVDSHGHLNSLSIRMPYGYDAGHRNHSVDHWANLRFEDIYLNRSRYSRALRMGIHERNR